MVDTTTHDVMVAQTEKAQELLDYFQGQRAAHDARIAVKEGEVDAFLAAADATFLKRDIPTDTTVEILGDADKYYPLVFTSSASVNQVAIHRSVNQDNDLYGMFNGSLLFEVHYHQHVDGVYTPTAHIRWHSSHSYSPDIPATPQFIGKMEFQRAIRPDPTMTVKPCIWLRGRTSYQVGATYGGFAQCTGDGVVEGRSYGVLPDTHTPLVPFVNQA